MRSTLASLLLLLGAAVAFDFDDDESAAARDDPPSSEAIPLPVFHTIGGGEAKPRGSLFWRTVHPGATGGVLNLRASQTKLDLDGIEALRSLATQNGFYTISMPSILSDPSSPPLFASASACALLSSRFEEHIELTMSGSSKDRVLALSYFLPVVPPSCSKAGLPRIALDEVVFNTSATMRFPGEGPKPYGKVHEASFLPRNAQVPAQAQGGGPPTGAAGEGGEGQQAPQNQSFLRKYWMYILPVMIMLMMGGGDEPAADGKGGGGEGGGGGGGGARPAARRR